MIQILDEQIKRSRCEIGDLYPNCKFLFLKKNITDKDGYLYAISTKEEEINDFCDFWHSIVDEQCKFRELYCVMCGSYRNPDIITPLSLEGVDDGNSN